MVGSAVVRALQAQGYHNIVTRTSSELNLTDQAATESFYKEIQPEYVVVAAAKVGGILANGVFP
jgi:GDP-L-fucose synthase